MRSFNLIIDDKMRLFLKRLAVENDTSVTEIIRNCLIKFRNEVQKNKGKKRLTDKNNDVQLNT
jgi:hypothetical protein